MQTQLAMAGAGHVEISTSTSQSLASSTGVNESTAALGISDIRTRFERASSQEELRATLRRTGPSSPHSGRSPLAVSVFTTSVPSSVLASSSSGKGSQRISRISGQGRFTYTEAPELSVTQFGHQDLQTTQKDGTAAFKNPFLDSDEEEEAFKESTLTAQSAPYGRVTSSSRRTSSAAPLVFYSDRSPSPTKTSYVHSTASTAAAADRDRTQLTNALNSMLRSDAAHHQASSQQRRPSDASKGVPTSGTRGVFSPPGQPASQSTHCYYRPSSIHGSKRSVKSSLSSLESQLEKVELQKKLRTRRAAVRELVHSERSFLSDMIVLRDACLVPAKSLVDTDCLAEREVKTLFSNLPALIAFTEEFLELLSAAGNVDLRKEECFHVESDQSVATDSQADEDTVAMTDWIGEAFLQSCSQMAMLYAEYCSRHEAAVARLQELESGGVPVENRAVVAQYFKDCVELMKGKTNAWDVGSLLIKPVQRVLKYPLLLQAIFKETPSHHLDFERLKSAITETQKVADHVNEIKKRKDLVEQITGVKKKDVDFVHGINKKWSRAGQQLKLAAGIGGEIGVDPVFDALVERLDIIEHQSRLFIRYVALWLKSLKQHASSLDDFASTFERLYAMTDTDAALMKGPQRMLDVIEYRKRIGLVMDDLLRQLEAKARDEVLLPVEEIPKMRAGIDAVMAKRGKKVLDYIKAEGIRTRGDIPDKALQESADAYVSIHSQLLDELPKFIGYCIRYLDRLLLKLGALQRRFYDDMATVLRELAWRGGFLGINDGAAPTTSAICQEYVRRLTEDSVDELIKSLSIIGWSKQCSDVFLRPFDFRTRSSSMTELSNYAAHGYYCPPSYGRTADRERSKSKAEGIPTGDLISFDPDPLSPSDPFADPEGSDDQSYGSPLALSLVSFCSPDSDGCQAIPQRSSSAGGGVGDGFKAAQQRGQTREAPTPSSFPSTGRSTPPLFSAAILYPYRPDDPGHLRLEDGDIVNIRRCSPGWWFGENIETGASGWFPQSYCVKME